MDNVIKLLQNEKVQQEQNITAMENHNFDSQGYRKKLLEDTKIFIADITRAIEILKDYK